MKKDQYLEYGYPFWSMAGCLGRVKVRELRKRLRVWHFGSVVEASGSYEWYQNYLFQVGVTHFLCLHFKVYFFLHLQNMVNAL